MSVREAQLEKYLVKRVEELGGITAKMTIQSRRGWPDRLVVMPGGRIVLVELKRPRTGVWSASQKVLFSKLGHLGANVMQLSSVDQIDRFIDSMIRRARLWPAGKGDDYD